MALKKVHGSFDVDGTSHIIVELPWQPETLDVQFAGDPTKIPPACDIPIGDDLGVKLIKEGDTYALRIHWSVNGVRTVNWQAARS